jgi:hypothetical protein
MEDAGIPRAQATAISGHKTESVYRRYLIGSEKRAMEAGKRMEEFFGAQQPRQGDGHQEGKVN